MPTHLYSQEKKGLFKDTVDNKFDIGDWLQKQSGFLPLGGVITEPAVDYGLVLAAVFFDPFSNKKDETIGGIMQRKGAPPDIAAIAAFATLNESWGLGVVYKGYWHRDLLRYKGALMWVDVNLDFYGNGNINLQSPIQLNYNGLYLVQELAVKMANHLYGGLNYSLFRFKITPSHEKIPDDLFDFNIDALSSSISPLVYFDNRDNIFTPDRGLLAKLVYDFNGDYVGSDFDFQLLHSYLLGYIPVARKYNIGLRYTGKYSSDNTPFFAKPYIDLRGVPIMRYQSQYVIELETEQKLTIGNRWAVLGFLGYGKAFYDKESFSSSPDVISGGLGFRYLMARAYKMWGGLDFAEGPEGFAFYITVGSAWGRY